MIDGHEQCRSDNISLHRENKSLELKLHAAQDLAATAIAEVAELKAKVKEAHDLLVEAYDALKMSLA